jgi:hypothetical protein
MANHLLAVRMARLQSQTSSPVFGRPLQGVEPKRLASASHSGYCEGELCCIESAVGAEYIGGKRRHPPGGAHSCMLPEVADEAFEVAD